MNLTTETEGLQGNVCARYLIVIINYKDLMNLTTETEGLQKMYMLGIYYT